MSLIISTVSTVVMWTVTSLAALAAVDMIIYHYIDERRERPDKI